MQKRAHPVIVFLSVWFWLLWSGLSVGTVVNFIKPTLWAVVLWVCLLLLALLMTAQFFPKKEQATGGQ